jgi:hypothetical protein
MSKHWGLVAETMKALLSLIRDLDDDGFEIRFTCDSSHSFFGRNSGARLEKSLQLERPRSDMHTDMRMVLGEIFDEYVRRKLPYSMSSNHRNMTIIVLTDGVWDGMADPRHVRGKIVRFVRRVRDIRGDFVERPVSIQFIQFGNDPQAVRMLQYLDDDLATDEDIE